MPDTASPETPPSQSYCAFLSYSHADNSPGDREWASWVQAQIEQFEIPPELQGQPNAAGGKIPQAIGAVFRDRKDLPTGGRATEQIWKALENSDALIVLCSPKSAKQEWVIDEVARWTKLEKTERVFPVLIAGDPRDSFPLGLDPRTAIAADLRPGYDPREEGCISAKGYGARLSAEVYTQQEIERRTAEYGAQLVGEMLRLFAGLLQISPNRLADRTAAHRAALANARAKEERASRIRYQRLFALSACAGLVALFSGWYGFSKARAEAKSQRDLQERTSENLRITEERLALEESLKEESKQRVELETKNAALGATALSDALSNVDQLLEKDRPQDALTHLAWYCRREPNNQLAATRLFSFLATRRWPLPVTGPIRNEGQNGTSAIERVRFNHDGSLALVARWAGDDNFGRAEIWQVEQRKILVSDIGWGAHGYNPSSFRLERSSFSADGRYFVSATTNPHDKQATLTLLNLTTGRSDVKQNAAAFTVVQFATDGRTLLTGDGGGNFCRWSLDLKPLEKKKLPSAIVGIGQDGAVALISDENRTALVGTKSGELTKTIPFPKATFHFWHAPGFESIWGLRTLPEEQGSDIYELVLWDANEPAVKVRRVPFEPVRVLQGPGKSPFVLGRHQNRYLMKQRAAVTGYAPDGVAYSHREIELAVRDDFYPSDAGFSNDQKWLSTVGDDQTARLWAMEGSGTGESVIVQAAHECTSVDLSPDARRWIVADNDYWRIWSTDSTQLEPKEIEVIKGMPVRPVLSVRGTSYSVKAGNRARDIITGQEVDATQELEPLPVPGDPPRVDSFNRDRTRKVSSSANPESVLSESDSGRVLQANLPTRNGFVRFSENGQRFLTVGDGPEGRMLHLWDSAVGAPLGQVHVGSCDLAGFSLGGEHFWTISKWGISIYDTATRRLMFGPLNLTVDWVVVSEGAIYALRLDSGGTARRYRIPFLMNRATSEMCDLAEAVASRRVAGNGTIEVWPSSKEDFRKLALRARALKEQSPFAAWMNWLLHERESELGKGLNK